MPHKLAIPGDTRGRRESRGQPRPRLAASNRPAVPGVIEGHRVKRIPSFAPRKRLNLVFAMFRGPIYDGPWISAPTPASQGHRMFTQKQIASGLGITKQAVSLALHGCTPTPSETINSEGGRNIKRSLLVYAQSDVFALAARTGKLLAYSAMCEAAGLPAETFHVPRKEVEFGDTLRKFLPDGVEIVRQQRIGRYLLDFYLPAFSLAIEYDEPHHRKHVGDDAQRQQEISAMSGVEFIRVTEGLEERGLFAVAMAIGPRLLSG